MPYKDPTVNKAKQKQYSKSYYQKNREVALRRNQARKVRERKRWQRFKSAQSCTHCGAKHPAIIDFHHVIRANKQSVNYLAVKVHKVDEAIREVTEKCIPLCSNCHRILHWKEHKRRARARQRKRLKK